MKPWVSDIHEIASSRFSPAECQRLEDAAASPPAVEELVPLIPANAYRPVIIREHTYGYFTLGVRIPGLGKVRIVVSFEHESLTGRSVVLVKNWVDSSADKIIGLYLHRSQTETFYQDSKGLLGFNKYRMRSAEAIGKHWCLVFVAYSLLHPTSLPGCSSPWYSSLTDYPTADRVFAQLFAKQRGMVLIRTYVTALNRKGRIQ